jgi:hypothetical protein
MRPVLWRIQRIAATNDYKRTIDESTKKTAASFYIATEIYLF